jgi:membrane protease YdiL (CAAX protease family)
MRDCGYARARGRYTPSHVSAKSAIVIASPVLICVSTYAWFNMLAHRLGPVRGYFCGFLLYWGIWCIGFPVWALGRARLRGLFAASAAPVGRPAWAGVVSLTVPLVLGYVYAFPRALSSATLPVVIGSAALALVNGSLEEILWRGLFVATFSESLVLGHLYPAIGFALWHLAPLSIFPNAAPGGSMSFVVTAGLVGLMWGWLARSSRSIAWTTVAHVLFDFSGLGARRYFR